MITTKTRGFKPPSGQQFTIAHDGAKAEITQVGATLRSYAVDEQHVIDGFGIDESATDGRGQVLAPWPNRLTGGRYEYGGTECQAPLNEPSRQSAIHGLVRWLDWSLVSHDPTSVTLSCDVRPQPGYEWQLGLEITYALDAAGLSVTSRAVNADSQRAPFGIGFHPYLTFGSSIDTLYLKIPATGYVSPAGAGGGPTMVSVRGTPLDFTESRQIETTKLDNAFGELTRGADERAVAVLDDPDGSDSLRLWVDNSYRYLMVYTADQVGQSERRRQAIAIEPMTCPPDALRTGTDLIEFDPGETWQGSWSLQVT